MIFNVQHLRETATAVDDHFHEVLVKQLFKFYCLHQPTVVLLIFPEVLEKLLDEVM
jgi:hypothetical protein